MKKLNTQIVTQPQPTKPARMLFGISSDELRAVHGGGGIIINAPRKTSAGGG